MRAVAFSAVALGLRLLTAREASVETAPKSTLWKASFARKTKCDRGLSFSMIGTYIRFVGLTDYGDKWAMK